MFFFGVTALLNIPNSHLLTFKCKTNFMELIVNVKFTTVKQNL